MSDIEKSSSNSIDEAISYLDEQIKIYRIQASTHLRAAVGIIYIGSSVIGFLYYWTNLGLQQDIARLNAQVRQLFNRPEVATTDLTDFLSVNPDVYVDSTWLLAMTGVVVGGFGIFMSLYRRSLIIIERLDHQVLGFRRIRVAANNYGTAGFESEVRVSLTQNAFDLPTTRTGKVESPLPGHPGSDLTTTMVNRLMDMVEDRGKRGGN